jgi:hypothetical protein
MSIGTRLLKIENELKKTNNDVIIRLVNSDGSYPEREEDKQSNSKIMKIMVEGVTSEELRSWAE